MKKVFSYLAMFFTFCFLCLSFVSCGYSTKKMGNINASVKLPDNFVMRSDNDAETLFKERLLGFSDEDFESLKKFTDLKIKSYAYNKDYESYILFAQFNLKKLSKVMKKNITNASDFYKLLGTNEIRVKEQSLNGIDVVSEESGYGKISHYAIKGNQCFFCCNKHPSS